MSDIKLLAGVCGGEFHKILRCGAGGRNHASCCSRRGVPGPCLSLCNGVIVDSLLVTATTCVPYIGNIALCFEEGKFSFSTWLRESIYIKNFITTWPLMVITYITNFSN